MLTGAGVQEMEKLLTFVVVGGGPTGVEVAAGESLTQQGLCTWTSTAAASSRLQANHAACCLARHQLGMHCAEPRPLQHDAWRPGPCTSCLAQSVA